MKGILLCGGQGTRLLPLTVGCNKQLLPIYDKPSLFYPLSLLMLAGIRDILVISTPKDISRIESLLEDGSQLGISISYAPQYTPDGIPSALDIGRKFIGDDNVMMVLGDNFLQGNDLQSRLTEAVEDVEAYGGANVFLYHTNTPEKFGVAVLDQSESVLRIVEKPKEFVSPYAITGIYIMDNRAIDIARKLKPSPRGETEITDLLRVYLEQGQLRATTMNKGFYWTDTGSAKNLYEASTFVKLIQESQNTSIACLEEIAHAQGFIDDTLLKQQAEKMKNSEYGKYLLTLVEGK